MAGIYGGILAVGCLLGDSWPDRSDLPAIILFVALLVSIGAMMWQGDRVDRISREEHEVHHLEKWYGDKQARTLKERFLAWLDGLE
jgi:Tfp pilus assembly protein PilO